MDAARVPSTSTDAPRTRCTMARVSWSLQHPGVVAADDGLDLARAEVAGRPDRSAQAERQARDVRDLPEAVAVLEQERLAVDLDELTAIRGGRGHATRLEEAVARAMGRAETPDLLHPPARSRHRCRRRRSSPRGSDGPSHRRSR